jgi:hypothetical protein
LPFSQGENEIFDEKHFNFCQHLSIILWKLVKSYAIICMKANTLLVFLDAALMGLKIIGNEIES